MYVSSNDQIRQLSNEEEVRINKEANIMKLCLMYKITPQKSMYN